jgi:hypothetical protein
VVGAQDIMRQGTKTTIQYTSHSCEAVGHVRSTGAQPSENERLLHRGGAVLTAQKQGKSHVLCGHGVGIVGRKPQGAVEER